MLLTWEVLGSVSYNWWRELCSVALIADGAGKALDVITKSRCVPEK